jgi:hypothetical protein
LLLTASYQQEHESTTVGLMLGLAASYRKTMHPAISKVKIICKPLHFFFFYDEKPYVNFIY